ncbi:MAG: transporter substrate-binding domain-containing protein [Burkholderiaceae bacterium]|nr:transporter substrate-binding domain-containing protein [Burkholderiaceae bacterium]
MGDQDLPGIAPGFRVNRLRRSLLGAACALAVAPLVRANDLPDLRRHGRIRVAVYRDFPPFSDGKGGIDVEIGQALARQLQVQAEVLPFDAGEAVEDDLRNMVWRGTLLGYGPADVMMHAPVDTAFAERNPKVKLLAPYFREKLQVARNVARIPRLDSLAGLQGMALGAEDGTLASIVLLSAEGGRLRENVQHYPSSGLALEDLKAGRLAAVVGLRSELQYGIAGVDGYELSDVVAPGVPRGWLLGLAVKSEDESLADALKSAMKDLVDSGTVKSIFRAHKVVSWDRP